VTAPNVRAPERTIQGISLELALLPLEDAHLLAAGACNRGLEFQGEVPRLLKGFKLVRRIWYAGRVDAMISYVAVE